MNYQSHDNNLQYLWFLEMGMSIDQLYNNKQSYFLPLHTLSGCLKRIPIVHQAYVQLCSSRIKKYVIYQLGGLPNLDNKLIELTELL
jgi:hypothetical protein